MISIADKKQLLKLEFQVMVLEEIVANLLQNSNLLARDIEDIKERNFQLLKRKHPEIFKDDLT